MALHAVSIQTDRHAGESRRLSQIVGTVQPAVKRHLMTQGCPGPQAKSTLKHCFALAYELQTGTMPAVSRVGLELVDSRRDLLYDDCGQAWLVVS